MNTIFLLLLALSFRSLMAMDYTSYTYYRSTKQLKSILRPIGAWYDPIPGKNAPLDENKVMNTFWRNMQEKSQEEKDEAFKKHVFRHEYNDYTYSVWRYQVAAGVYAGANPNLLPEHEYPTLSKAVLHDDYALAQLLLEHNADPNIQNYYEDHPLFNAKNVAMARLLVARGASVQTRQSHVCRWNVLHNVMIYSYDPGLITYYLSVGVHHTFGSTSLDELSTYEGASGHSFEKYAQAFLASGIKAEEIGGAFEKIRLKNGVRKDILEKNYQTFLDLIAKKSAVASEARPFNVEADCCICFTEDIERCIIPCPTGEKHSATLCVACLEKITKCPICQAHLK